MASRRLCSLVDLYKTFLSDSGSGSNGFDLDTVNSG